MKNGEVVHTKTQARFHNHRITRPVTSMSSCENILNKSKREYEKVCFPGNTCEKVEITCQRMTSSEFFSDFASHRKYNKNSLKRKERHSKAKVKNHESKHKKRKRIYRSRKKR